MSKPVRRFVVTLIALTATGTWLPPLYAQSFPSKPIRLVVPYLPGGLPDVIARLVAQKMTETTGRTTIVDNRSGASGIIAAEHVAKSDPDGHTIFVGDIGHYAINPALYKKLSYSPTRDFTPITAAVHGPLFLVINPELGVSTLKELIDLAKRKPGTVNYGSPGNGSVHQLAMAQLGYLANVDLVHIPHRSLAQAVPALIKNDVSIMFISPPSVNSYVKAGKLKVLANGGERRTASEPDLPTVAESGFVGFNAVTTVGFFAPSATPPNVVAWLNREMTKALRSKDVESRMPDLGVSVVAGTGEEFAYRIRADLHYYQQLVKQVGIQID